MKKFPSIDWERSILVVGTWIVRLRHLTFVFAALIPLLVIASWLDPQRPVREQQRVAQVRASVAQDEARHVAEAKEMPPTGVVGLDFHKLDFRLPPEAEDPALRAKGFAPWAPAGIKAYDGREVSIDGFMLPTKTENGAVREFLILANQQRCCYGQEPKFCGFIVARVKGRPLSIRMDQPLTFEGVLHVGDVFDGNYWTAFYRLDCTSAERSLLASNTRWK